MQPSEDLRAFRDAWKADLVTQSRQRQSAQRPTAASNVAHSTKSSAAPQLSEKDELALSYYVDAVQFESDANLNEAMIHYRKAFHLNRHVDRLYWNHMHQHAPGMLLYLCNSSTWPWIEKHLRYFNAFDFFLFMTASSGEPAKEPDMDLTRMATATMNHRVFYSFAVITKFVFVVGVFECRYWMARSPSSFSWNCRRSGRTEWTLGEAINYSNRKGANVFGWTSYFGLAGRSPWQNWYALPFWTCFSDIWIYIQYLINYYGPFSTVELLCLPSVDMISLERLGETCKGLYLLARDTHIWRQACRRVWDIDCQPVCVVVGWFALKQSIGIPVVIHQLSRILYRIHTVGLGGECLSNVLGCGLMVYMWGKFVILWFYVSLAMDNTYVYIYIYVDGLQVTLFSCIEKIYMYIYIYT